MTTTIETKTQETGGAAARVVALLSGKWEYGGFHSQSHPRKMTSRDWWNAVPTEDVPALTSCRELMSSDGYEFTEKPVRVSRCETTTDEGTAVTYSVWHTAHFVKGGGRLAVVLRGGGETVEEAAASASARVESVTYAGEPVEGGRGQLKRCREIAARLFAEHGKHLPPDGSVVVHYRTKAGRGGWKEKTAERRFRVSELSETKGERGSETVGV